MTPDASPLSLLRNSAANFANANCTAGTLRSMAASFVKTVNGDIDDSQDGDDNVALRYTVKSTRLTATVER